MKKVLKQILVLLIASVISLTSFSPIYAQYEPENLEMTLGVGNAVVSSGEQNYLDLKIKSTGAQTTFTDAKITVEVNSIDSINFDLTDINKVVNGKFDKVEIVGNQLIISADKFLSGQYFELPLKFNTKNGISINGKTFEFKAKFESNELDIPFTDAVSVVNKASSPVKINKTYLGMSVDSPESQGLFFGADSYWETRAVIDYKDTGQQFVKENTKIIITETYNENLVYVGMETGTDPVVDPVNRTLTWTFDAPTYAEQSNSVNAIWETNFIVKYTTIKEPDPSSVIKNVGVDAKIEFTNVSDEDKVDTDNALVSLYPRNQDVPILNGEWNVFGHWGALDGFGNHGFAGYADMNQQPTIYPWGTLTFAHRMSAMYSGKYDGYSTYLWNYLIDDYLDFQTLKVPNRWVYFPDVTTGQSLIEEFPEYDIYFLNKKVELDINGNNTIAEEDIVAVYRFGTDFNHGSTITRADVLAKKGLPNDTHIAQVRYDFTKAPGGMFSLTGPKGSNMFRISFNVKSNWKESPKYIPGENRTRLSNDITIFAINNLVYGGNDNIWNSPTSPAYVDNEIWDFREDTISGKNGCVGRPDNVTGGTWRDGNNTLLSCMYIMKDHNGNVYPNGFGESLFWEVNSDRHAYITEDPKEEVPTVSNTIQLLDQINGEIHPGNNVLNISVVNHDVSAGVIQDGGLVSYVLLPKSVDVITNSAEAKDHNGVLVDVVMTKTDKVSGQFNIYKVEWKTQPGDFILRNESLSLNVDVIVSDLQQDLVMNIMTDFPNNDNFNVLAVTDPTPRDTRIINDELNLAGHGTEYKLIKASNGYHVVSDYYIRTNKLVKGSLDADFSDLGETTIAGTIDYKLQFTNKEGRNITSFVLLDILPSVDDLGITDGVARGSDFGVILTGPIITSDKFTVQYSASKNPSRDDLNDVLITSGFEPIAVIPGSEEPNWLNSDEVSDWSTIHSFKVVLNEGKSFLMEEMAEIQFTTKLDPQNKDIVSEEGSFTAWNSFALAVNGKPTIEPLQVGATITNVRLDITAKKVWVGGPSVHPTIELQLLRNGDALGDPVTLENGTTSYTWTDLDKTDINGVDYVYTVDEVKVPDNYEKDLDGLVITNTYVSPLIDITAKKVWVGGPSVHPTIELQLLRNGDALGVPVTLENGTTSYTWTDLDKTDINGVDYVYTVDEVKVPDNYKKDLDGLVITNTYVSPLIDITAKKVWVGGPSVHPTIELQLLRNGDALGAPVTLENGSTSYTWTDLDKTDINGVDYVYTVDEVKVPDNYVKVRNGLTITNTFVKIEKPKGTELPNAGVGNTGIQLAYLACALGAVLLVVDYRKRKKIDR